MLSEKSQAQKNTKHIIPFISRQAKQSMVIWVKIRLPLEKNTDWLEKGPRRVFQDAGNACILDLGWLPGVFNLYKFLELYT